MGGGDGGGGGGWGFVVRVGFWHMLEHIYVARNCK